MGACSSKKNVNINDSDSQEKSNETVKPPLRYLKKSLIAKLHLAKDHHFTIFAKYHFWNSYRRSLLKLQRHKLYLQKI
jgi:hypothetical protein